MFENAFSKIGQPSGGMRLRELSGSDSGELHALVIRNRKHLTQHGDYEDLVARSVGDWREALDSPEDNVLTLGMAIEGTLIGTASLIYYKPRTFGLGYWIEADHQGRGHVTNACRALMDYARAEQAAGEIWAGIKAQNSPSIAVAKKLGLRLERTQDTHLSFLLRLDP